MAIALLLLPSPLVNVLANQRSFLLSNLSAATLPRLSPLTNHYALSLALSLSCLFLRGIFDGGNRENLGWIFSNFARKIVFFVRYEKEKGRKEERIDGSPLENRRFFERTAQRLLLPLLSSCVASWPGCWLREDLINERARGGGKRKTGMERKRTRFQFFPEEEKRRIRVFR